MVIIDSLPVYSGKYDEKVFGDLRDRLSNDETLVPVNFNENSTSVLEMRYLKKDGDGNLLENPMQMLKRVAAYIAYPDHVYNGGNFEATYETAKTFYNLMASKNFMPNSPTLMNAGRGGSGTLSGCFVLPVPDSIEGIFDSIKTTAMIQKAGGGTGFSFDNLRPTGDYIKSSGGTTSGPISFWRVFAEATSAIQQGAFRRGANMGMMSVWHPDILKFINVKKDDSSFSNFNISVKVKDAWMNELLANPDSPLIVRNPRTNTEYFIPRGINIATYGLRDLIPLELHKKIEIEKIYTKGDIWKDIIDNAHAIGDPGLAFIDRMNQDNPTPKLGEIEATNPCGEQPLLPYESCNLGSIHLRKMVEDKVINYDKLRQTTRGAVKFLDNVVDSNSFPYKEITDIVTGNRKIGLGVMGWADMLAKLRIRYGSDQSIDLAGQVMKTIHEEAILESEKLAEERGAFPNFDGSIYAGGKPRRNAAITTIAPTGTIAIIAEASPGIEGFFGNAYSHRDSEGNIRRFTNDSLRKELTVLGLNADKVFDELFKGRILGEIEGVPVEIAQTYVTSHDIPIQHQIAMQAAFQKYVHSAVSKTINLVTEATTENFEHVYTSAFLAGVKGITAYRNGCRDNQPIIFGKLPEKLEKKVLVGTPDCPLKVPEMMPAIRIRQATPFGHIHTHLVFDPSNNYRVLETFNLLGNAGDEEAATLEALGRCVSLYLRSGGHLENIIDQFIGIGSGTSTPTSSGEVKSIAMGLAKNMLKFVVARDYFNIEDLLLGKVDYDDFASQVSEIIRKTGTDGISKLMTGFKQGQDFLERNPAQPDQSKGGSSSGRKLAFNETCPQCKQGVLIRQEGCMRCSCECGFSRC